MNLYVWVEGIVRHNAGWLSARLYVAAESTEQAMALAEAEALKNFHTEFARTAPEDSQLFGADMFEYYCKDPTNCQEPFEEHVIRRGIWFPRVPDHVYPIDQAGVVDFYPGRY